MLYKNDPREWNDQRLVEEEFIQPKSLYSPKEVSCFS
jgi:hypothetical protein